MTTREERSENRERFVDLPVLSGPRLIGELPSRFEVYEEIFAADQEDDDA